MSPIVKNCYFVHNCSCLRFVTSVSSAVTLMVFCWYQGFFIRLLGILERDFSYDLDVIEFFSSLVRIRFIYCDRLIITQSRLDYCYFVILY